MIDFSKLLFLPLDMPSPPDISKFLDTLNKNLYINDSYRKSPSIMLMDKNGKWIINDTELDEFKIWAEQFLFSWTGKSQLVVIVTPPYKSMSPHIDCAPFMFHTWQHKFRYVFRGKTSTLRYITKDKFINVYDITVPYIISGKWPHDMYNNLNETKYTLCLGSPWEPGDHDKKYLEKLEESYRKNKDRYISSEGEELPDNFVDLFNKEKYPDAYKYFS